MRRGVMVLPLILLDRPIDRSRRAVSPLVAVLVIAAVAVGLAVTLAAWMQSATLHYTQFEAVRSQGSWSSRQDGELLVVTRLENAGNTPMAIADVMLNGKPFGTIGSGVSVVVGTGSVERALEPDAPSSYVSIPPGEVACVKIAMPGTSVPSGQKLTVGFVTSKGLQYLETVAID